MEKVLVFGGTQFIGRNLVELLLKRTDLEITLFNRQRTAAHLFPSIKRIKGDRNTSEVQKIASQKWDYVIDLSCYFPNSLQEIIKHLNKDIKRYISISTCSVYDTSDTKARMKDELAPVVTCDRMQREDVTPSSYGNRKIECERILIASEIPYLILRPALVFGPHDHTDRMYYWLYQVRNHNKLLLPDYGERTFSITYVQDLAEVISCGLNPMDKNEIYNVISIPDVSIRKIVTSAEALMNKKCDIVNASADFLKKNQIDQWSDMPLWIDGDHFTFSSKKLIDDLNFEPISLEQGIAKTIAFYDLRGWAEPTYGISNQKREALIQELSKDGN